MATESSRRRSTALAAFFPGGCVAENRLFNPIEIEPPYLVFVGDTEDTLLAKTGFGIVHWRREQCLGQFRFDDAGVDLGPVSYTHLRAHET